MPRSRFAKHLRLTPMVSPLVRAHTAVKAGSPAEAAQWFEKACRENPDDSQARAWLGQCLCSIGRRDEGTPHLREAGRGLLADARGTKNINLVLEVAGQLQHWSDFPGALEFLSAVVNINPSEFRGYQLLAVTYAQLNRKKEALTAGEQALKLSPGNHMMQVFQGSLEADAGKNELAQERLEKSWPRNPMPGKHSGRIRNWHGSSTSSVSMVRCLRICTRPEKCLSPCRNTRSRMPA